MDAAIVGEVSLFIILAAVVSDSSFLLYQGISSSLIKKGYMREAYVILHSLVVFAFFVIAGCVAVVVHAEYTSGTHCWGLICRETVMIYYTLASIWFVQMLAHIRKHLMKWLQRQRFLEECFPAGEEEQAFADQLAVSLGIERKVEILQGYGLITAELVMDGGKPVIVLPADQYDQEQFSHVLTHELFHYKNGDRWFRTAFSILECIHWFNPLLGKVRDQLKRIDELYCDYCVCAFGKVEPGAYAETLYLNGLRYSEQWDMMEDGNEADSIKFIGNEMLLLERVRSVMEMDYGTKRKHSVIAKVLAVCMMVTVFTGSVVYAAATTVQDTLITNDDDVVMIEEEPQVFENEYVEYEIKPEEGSLDFGEYDEVEIDSFGTISAKLKKNSSWYTGKFKASSGQIITLTIKAKPTDLKLKIGIIEPDNTKRYISFTKSANPDFSLDQTGYYRIFIQNDTSKTVTLSGTYDTLDEK